MFVYTKMYQHGKFLKLDNIFLQIQLSSEKRRVNQNK